jgi:hypothetical protein
MGRRQVNDLLDVHLDQILGPGQMRFRVAF